MQRWPRALALLVAGGVLVGLGAGRTARADDDSRRQTPTDPKNLCEVADSNLARAMQAVLASKRPPPPSVSPAPAAAAWDHRSPPQWLDRVERRFTLPRAEREQLFAQGLVVPARLGFDSYTVAFHEIHQSQIPLYVSVDAIFHSVYASSDALIADLERELLAPRLSRVIDGLRRALPAALPSYPAEVGRDLEVYLAVAASLLGEQKAEPGKKREELPREAESLVAAARAARELSQVELFGRSRVIDFSQFTPRGHYAGDAKLTAFFQAAMWLSRLEFNLVSRSSRSSAPGMVPDPRETPREAVVALALADLAQRAELLGELTELDRAWTLLGGAREDISLPQLQALRAQAQLTDLRQPDVAERLRRAIGDRFQRTARLHYMPQGSTVLPAIATLLGPRVVGDAAAIRLLAHSEVPQRERLGAADLAYTLGQDRALVYLADELRTYPTLRGQLDKARGVVETATRPGEKSTPADLYGAWLRAARALSERPAGVLPSFMQRPEFLDLRLNSAIAAIAQLKHNYVLLAGQGYNEGGCEIPGGYVEPAPAVYDALIGYADRGEQALRSLDPSDQTAGRAYFLRLGRILRVLRAIIDDELSGRALSVEAQRFLAMVVETAPGSSGGPPTFTGWYFDLFRRREEEGMAKSSFIADFYTAVNVGEVAYVGVSGVRLGLFVVDTGGRPRVFVGPVARAFEHHGPLSRRLDDESAQSLPAAQRIDPWAAGYTVADPAPVAPRLTLSYDPDGTGDISVDAPAALGPVTFTLLDHHRVPLHRLTRAIGAGSTVFRFPKKSPAGRALTGAAVGGLSIQIGSFIHWAEVHRSVESGVYINLGGTP